ncbi:UHRF1-binding protein 1 isoform X1 [Electrophorus electricus]|uniref:UHRF1-binding protein 1 isoform X1 n=3 Tax=Electrophorus electricus TaxID=8005 RepID=UPI0015D04E82|nr:UHRF1-binding protein 1 isoform X1 [Electrophorus electricus]
MAGIIKKQILKHLSRFTKNLSPDKINLSTLKGEGQLSNLELDEEVLQNMLDLPTWLAVARVYCNKAAIRIQWTKLKTSPICLFLDKVEVEMRTCDEPRPPNGPSPIAITAGQSEYGFAERVVEGMSVVINSIVIKVQARAFRASFELWQLQGCSLNPKWQKTDLRYTRITHPKRGEVLTFKEINWQSLRIEADAMESEDQDLGSTPLRLITNQGRIRIALKRRVKDCNVLASKLLFILDDLLWVLTDSQLKAVIHYAESLSEAMERSAQQRKSTAAETLQTAPPSPGPHHAWAEPPPAAVGTPSTLAQYFDLHDVKESSYHTFISRLDLHVCNDGPPVQSDEPPIPGSQGAMQLTFRKLGCDYYPFHRPGDDCRHWEHYCGAMDTRTQWVAKLLQDFQRRVENSGFPAPPGWRPPGNVEGSPNGSPSSLGGTAAPAAPGDALKMLRSSCMVVRVDDLDIHQVSTGERTSKPKQSLLSCNRKSLNLPDNTPAIHLQFTEYYYPSCPGVPVPCSNLYGQLNGLQLFADVPSLVWMAVFSRGLLQTLEQVKAFYHLQDSSRSEEHVDVRVDATHLKLIVPLDSSILDHPDRPQLLCAALPQAVLSNTRHSPHGSYGDLRDTCSSFGARPFFRAASARGFPCEPNVFHPLPPAFLRAAALDEPQAFSRPPRARDVWGVSLSRVALGFEGPRRAPRGRVLPFMEPFTAAVWMCRPAAFPLGPSPPPGPASLSPAFPGQEEGPECPAADVHVLAQAVTPVRVWLNHYQYLALLRVKDSLSRLAADLGRDTRDPHGRNPKLAEPPTACVSVLLEVLQVGLLLPPATEEEPKEEAVSREGSDSQSLTDSEEPAQGREEDGEGEVSVEEACEALEEGPAEQTGRVATSAASPPPSPGIVLVTDTSTFSLEGELSSALSATKDVTKDALSASLDLTKGALSITRDAFSILSRGSPVTKLFSAKEPGLRADELSTPLMGGACRQPLKHSTSQNSCDSATLESSIADDGVSVDSDTSENFIIIQDSDSGLESMRPNGTAVAPDLRVSPPPGIEGASSAEMSISLSQSTEDITHDTVSVLLLSVGGVSSVVELHGEDVVMATEAQSLTMKQLGNQKMSGLLAGMALAQAASSSHAAPPSPGPRSLCCPPVVALRMELGPGAGRHCAAAEGAGFLEACVRGCRAELSTSALNTLGPFLEDELSADAQPLRLSMHDTRLTLKDDGPRVYPTAPQPTPASFFLDGVVLERLDDGVLTLRCIGSQSGDRAAGAGQNHDTTCCGPGEEGKTLESQLSDTQAALTAALSDRERLLLEIHKYDPFFNL